MFHIAKIFQKSFFENQCLPNLQKRTTELSKNTISTEQKRLLFSTFRHAWLFTQYLDMVFPKWSKKKKTASLGLSFLFLGLEEKIFAGKSIHHTFQWVHQGLSSAKTDWLKPIARALLEKAPANAELFYKQIEKKVLSDRYIAEILSECPGMLWTTLFDHPALWIRIKDNDTFEKIPKTSILERRDHSILIKSNTDQIRQLFEEGLISYQNIASQSTYRVLDHIAEYINENPLKIIETCAAPGGKSLLILEWLHNNRSGRTDCVTLCDQTKEKTETLKKNIERVFPACSSSVSYVEHDWEKNRLPFKANLIWVDTPCSGSGVIKKHPDVLWKDPIENRLKLHDIQISILTNALACLEKDGILIYTTCSLDKKENDDVIEKILQENADLSCLEKVISNLGKKTKKGYLIIPSDIQDGLYIAVLKRNS